MTLDKIYISVGIISASHPGRADESAINYPIYGDGSEIEKLITSL